MALESTSTDRRDKFTDRVRPDKFTDRVEWNRSWEDDLRVLSAFANSSRSSEVSYIFQRVGHILGGKEQRFVGRQNENIVELQIHIREYALRKLATDGLEERWRSLEHGRRQELILEAFYQVSCVSPDMESNRRWCPDMTIDDIAARNGQLFLDLLNTIITKTLNARKPEPIFFPHPFFGENNESLNPFEVLVQSNRSYFVSMVVWHIVLIMDGDDKESYTTNETPNPPGWKAFLEQTLGKDAKKDVRTKKAVRNAAKNYIKRLEKSYVNICVYCRNGTSELGPEAKLMNCSKCKKGGRTTRYCSRECQTKDWKTHKQICGTAEDIHGKIPVSDPGFEKSHALLHQISLLEDPVNIDYMYMKPGNLNDMGFIIADFTIRMAFLIMRRRALQNGQKDAVKFMFNVLSVNLPNHPEYSINGLKLQLKREYGVDVDSVDGDFDAPTDEEMEWVEKLLLALVSRDGKVDPSILEKIELAKQVLSCKLD